MCIMFFCCNHQVKQFNSFYIPTENFKYKIALIAYCPHCGSALYKEMKTSFNDIKHISKQRKGEEAQKLISKALFNRLIFFEKAKTGNKQDQNWFYGDFSKTREKDENGNPIYLQLRCNFNREYEILNKVRVKYY